MTTHFDYLVLGGGSGGVASARRAASYGASVAVIERGRENGGAGLGGTCVNFGCVPKKIMFNAAMHAEFLHTSSDYGFETTSKAFNWNAFKQKRDAYVTRLNGIYESNLEKADVKYITGTATFVSDNKIQVNDTVYTAKHILVAVGGVPAMPDIPGADLCISSDGFFALEEQPKKVRKIHSIFLWLVTYFSL